ncbi:MAG: S9 family peptidase [Acidimicrobiales bacterium]
MPGTNHDASFDLDTFFSMPRVGGLSVAPDGSRLVTTVKEAAPDGKRFVSSLWELDPAGAREPRRLTRSKKGESLAGFLHDGSILFTSARPHNQERADDDDAGGDDDRARLWLLPADGGEPRVVASPPNGLSQVNAARSADIVAYRAERWRGAETDAADAERAKTRRDKGVTAQLFDRYPIRFWDHYIPSSTPRLFAGSAPDSGGDTPLTDVRDITSDAGMALTEFDDSEFDLAPDGSFVVSTWLRDVKSYEFRVDLVHVDVATGDRRTIAHGGEEFDFVHPAISPDGTKVAAIRGTVGSPEQATDQTLWLVDIESGDGTDLTPEFDRWPGAPVWAADGSAIFFTADEGGHTPIWSVDVASGAITRLTADGCHAGVAVAPDGSALYAMVSTYDSPPEAVRLDPTTPDQRPRPIPTPGHPLPVELPGRLESITSAADDGVPIQSWLVVPNDASADDPAPLVLWIHGGPLSAWGPWHWRWNPQLLAALGYAVLLPNPALSTGFGHDFIQRGWGRWGREPYTDIMSALDAVVARPDIDGDRVAAMGGSFGGYMANWIAGQTDRFRCIVTHASLYALSQFHGTTDLGVYWEQEFGDPYANPERYVENSPDRHVADFGTPMLVIHGELDHRVPIGEALRLWTDLARHGHTDAKFLYFPDENHWILKPNNARVWHEVVFAFLAEHVLDDPSAWKSEFLESLGIGPSGG